MANPSFLLISTAVVAIPSVSVGAYYLSSSGKSASISEETVASQEQSVKNAEQSSIPLEDTQETLREEPKASIQQDPTFVNGEETISSDEISRLQFRPGKSSAIGNIKSLISHLLGSFHYDSIDLEDERSEQFKVFVEETDNLRRYLQETVTKDLLAREGYSKQDIKEIVKNATDFTPITSEEGGSYWSKLAQIRKEEVLTQLSLDSKEKPQQKTPVGNEVTKESIEKFCMDPSEENSHLGMHSPTRTNQEITKEYRFFTYYSYCTKESYYLNDKLKFVENE